MKTQFVKACVLCFLCTAHTHCYSYNDNNTHTKAASNHSFSSDRDGGGITTIDNNNNKNNSFLDKHDFIQLVFQKFGDGKTISIEGLEKLLKAINLEDLISSHMHETNNINSTLSNIMDSGNSSSSTITQISNDFPKVASCVSSESLMGGATALTPTTYKDVCPVLLSQFLPKDIHTSKCGFGVDQSHSHNRSKMQDQIKVWLYSTLSIIVISLCGLLGVTVIPIMQKVFYQHFLQFLVALAVGTLCGDALLHLLPHAMMPEGENEHAHSHSDSMDHHDINFYRGLVAMFGVIFFYFMEKCLTLVAEWRKSRHQKKQKQPKILANVRVMRDLEGPTSTAAGETLCKHKYSSYPYCYGEIADNPDGHMKPSCDLTEGSPNTIVNNEEKNDSSKPVLNNKYLNDHNNVPDLTKENELLDTDKSLIETGDHHLNLDDRYTVIIREHESTHHGHSHTHGHVHSAPQSLSSVALMVVLGDGLHNFTDGMAIGAAFSSNIAGGFSTALAVFCHELPHELGDFAVLLQAGMSAKQAVFYNLLSSILCFIGMCFGVFLGHNERTTQWVFAAAAGMFLYIALVDMIPELTNSHSKSGALVQCVLQLAGLMTGTGIMFLIAIYEHDLKHAFSD
uniref:Zinc transporter foi n=1 Tax=Clastoptera arizonana TaxID=38151 RepID=A0A1B6DE89_9HEMI